MKLIPDVLHINRDGYIPFWSLRAGADGSYLDIKLCTKNFDTHYSNDIRFPFTVIASEVRK